MRKDEFIVAATSYQKTAAWIGLIPILLVIVITAWYAPSYYHPFEDYLNTKFSGAISAILALMPVALPVVGALCFVIAASRRLERKLGVNCPHCGKNVAHFKMIVIASKNCPFCGLKVLDDNL
jgi:DNA-directed RNA polymerase subunit RPC12/RpoP